MDSQKLARFIKDSGLSYAQNSKSFIFTCPLCNRKDKLYIRKDDGRFACWKCRETEGFQGAPEFAFAELLEKPVSEIRLSLYGHDIERSDTYFNIKYRDLADSGEVLEDPEEEDLPALTFPYHCLPIGDSGTSKGVAYLESRGIPLDIAKHYKIRYSPEKQAIVFPAYVGSSLVGWQYRAVGQLTFLMPDDTIKRQLKAWSSDDIPRDRIFMFQDNLLGSSHAVLCEGPIDAIKAHQVGGGVAALGKAITKSQVSILLRGGLKRVYFALDPDAWAEIGPLIEKFNDAVELLKVEIPEMKGKKPDLGALSFEEAKRCILAAKPLLRNRMNFWLRPMSQ
jgi:hypothetical protein